MANLLLGPDFVFLKRSAARIVSCGLAAACVATLVACGQDGGDKDGTKGAGKDGAKQASKADAKAGKGGPGGPGGPVVARVVSVAPVRAPIILETVGSAEGSRQVEVRARVSGILQKRLYAEGEVVREGAVLFQIDREPFEIALAQSRAQLAQERARNEQATRESGRLKELAEKRAISQKEYDDSTSTLKLSNAALALAEANVRQAELNLSYTTVTAPVGGVSGRSLKSEGSLVTAGTDSLLTSLSQIDPIWVRFSLVASDFAKVPGGRLTRGGGNEVALTMADGTAHAKTGRINFAASQTDARLGTQELRAEFPNPARKLLPGDFVRVKVTAGWREKVFLVPQTAVLQNERGYFLFALDAEGKAQVRPVKTGEWLGTDWIITEGLAAGDRIVVDNLQRLQPGAVVKPAEAAAPAGAGGAARADGAKGDAGKGDPAKGDKSADKSAAAK